MNKMIRFGQPLAWAAVLLAGGAAGAEATDCVTPRGPGRVSLDCRAVPLGQVLRALSAVTPIDTKLIDSSAQATTIHVGLPEGSVAQALQASLDAAGISFVLYGAEGSDLKVFASAHSSGAAVRTASAARPVPEPQQDFAPDDMPEIEEPMQVPEKEVAVAPGFVPASARPEPFPAPSMPGLGSGGVGGLGAPAPPPLVTDPVKSDPAAAARPPQTMEEILARSAGQAGVPATPPEGKQVFATMEEILARTNPPKQ